MARRTEAVRVKSRREGITWRYVPTAENPADLGSRGGRLEEADQWWNGPKWLASQENWPADILDEPTEKSQAEAKLVRKVLAVAVDEEDEVEGLLRNFHLRKAVRVCAWMRRFTHNALRSRGKTRIEGPLTTKETNQVRLHWERQAQKSGEVEKDGVVLNLQLNQEGLLECRGRLRGEYPVYFPDTSLYFQRIVEVHVQTLHGGVGLTMSNVRGRYWIPKLRKLVKKVRRNCRGCKRFQAMAYAAPPPGRLPITHTEGVNPFQVIGVDYAGPLRYRMSRKREGKAYVLLYACSLTRGVYVDLLPSLETEECLTSLKKLIGR